MEQTPQIHITPTTELLEKFKTVIDEKFDELKKSFIPKQPTKLLNRKQKAEFFSVSVVTIDSWCDKGIIQPYRTGNRKFFKRSELEEALTKINK